VLSRTVRDWPWAAVTEDDWPELAQTMLRTLLTDHAALRRAGTDVLAERDLTLLSAHRATGWSEADVALLDELWALLARRRPRPRRRRPGGDAVRIEETLDVLELDASMRAAARERLRDQVDTDAGELHDVYGHIVVDEAQELSAMQWRMLVRRCPSGSMTVVGDLDQAMRQNPLEHWEELSHELPGRLRVFDLTVNYRTPAEIMAYVEQQREITGTRRHLPRSVRFTGRQPDVRQVEDHEIAGVIADVARAEASTPGTLAVIAPASIVGDLGAALDDLICLSPRGAKGLEFDVVVLVHPNAIAREDGGAALYVALTRATRDLIVLQSPAHAHD
jgi:DNA helicase IV